MAGIVGNGQKAILGLELRRHSVVAVEISAGRPQRHTRAPLAVDVLSGPTDLVGAEIADVLGKAGIQTRACVVCVPPDWAMTQTVELPSLAEADVASFLELEAERLFPMSTADLEVSISRFAGVDGKQHATLVAMAANNVASIVAALRAAKLRPVAITVGVAVLALRQAQPVAGVLVADERTADFAVAVGGGLAALRSLATPEIVDGTHADAQDFVREVKLSLRRVAGYNEAGVRTLQVQGPVTRRQAIVELLRPALTPMGVTLVAEGSVGDSESFAAAASAAGAVLAGETLALQFYRPMPTGLRALMLKLRQRGMLVRAAAAVGVLALLIAGAFAWRQARLSHLRSQWATMQPQVTRLQAIQDDIRTWRPWFDEEAHSLEMMSGLTSAFPERGDTWARVVQVRDQNLISCSGLGKTNNDCLELFNSLRRTPGISDLKVAQLRGENPAQFSVTFRWMGRKGQ